MTGVAMAKEANEPDQVTRVVTELIHFLQRRGYEPGERIPSERDLSSRFKVARGVLREALKSLEWMRYIDRKPNSGIFMRGVNQAETSIEALVLYSNLGIPFERETDLQCLEVRRLIEVQAIQLACTRRTHDDIARLRDIIERSRNGPIEGRFLSAMDYEFHMQIFESTKNNVLVQLVTPFYLMSERRREEFFSVPANFLKSCGQHVALVNAIEAGDSTLAAELMSMHIGQVEQHFTHRRIHGPDAKPTVG